MITCGYKNNSSILPLQVLDKLFSAMVLLRHIYNLRGKLDSSLPLDILLFSENLKEVDFLGGTLNLQNGTYRSYKKANDKLLYMHSSSNDTPQIIKQLPNSISERLSKNSSN